MTDAVHAPRSIPKAAQAIGILCVIFGLTGLIGSIYISSAMAGPVQAMIADPALRTDGYTHAIQIGSGLVSRLLMIAGGVGLLLGQRWGRWTAMTYGAFTLGLVVTSLFLHPAAPPMPEVLTEGIALEAPLADEAASESAEMTTPPEPTLFEQAMAFVSSAFLPVLTLGVMMREDVRATYGTRG